MEQELENLESEGSKAMQSEAAAESERIVEKKNKAVTAS